MSAGLFAVMLAAAFYGADSTPHYKTIGFRDFLLGMSLEDFLARPPMKDGTDVVCTKSTPGDWDVVTAEETKIGVVGCFYAHQISSHLRDATNRNIWEKEVPLSSTVNAFVRFSFFNGKLHQVKLLANPRDGQSLEDALVEKFGKPTRTLAGQYPVKAGFLDITTIDGFEKYWVKPGITVSIAYPDLLERKIAVTYLDSSATNEINKKIKSLRASTEGEKLKL